MSSSKGDAGKTPEGTPGLRTDDGPVLYDLAVIGGGPVGLHAALKAALLFKTCVLFDKGRQNSRVFFVPKIDNIPGYPEGVRGSELIRRGYDHIAAMEAQVGRRFVDVREQQAVTEVARADAGGEEDEVFVLHHRGEKDGKTGTVRARNIVLATGAVDQQPVTQEYRERDIETILPYANNGIASYCLLCDGHLVEGKRIAVIGCGESAGSVAASLKKNFHADPVLVTCGGLHKDHDASRPKVPDQTRAFLKERGIPIIDKDVKGWFGLDEKVLGIEFTDGSRERFDKGWISMGWYRVNSDLARQLGAALADDGTVRTNENCEALDAKGKTIRGLFAVGDVRHGSWKQIPIGWGEAETAVVHAFAHHL